MMERTRIKATPRTFDRLRERYDIMCQDYGTLPTIVRHIGFFARNLKRKLLK